MKKEYMKPDMKVFELKAKQQLLAGSDVQSLQFKRSGSSNVIEEFDEEFD